jgi:hypothetical protein
VSQEPGSGSDVTIQPPRQRPIADALPLQGLGSSVVPGAGLLLPRRLTFEAWLGIGRQLSAVVNASAWCLGDWLAYGQDVFTGRYRDAVERTCLDYQTLRNYAWVARRFALSRRRDALSFAHHAEVAALPEPEQDFWLRTAEQHGWSRNQLRCEVRASLRERGAGQHSAGPGHSTGPDGAACPGPDEPVLLLKVTPGQLGRYQRAASSQGLPVDAWAVQALDRATRHSLTFPDSAAATRPRHLAKRSPSSTGNTG